MARYYATAGQWFDSGWHSITRSGLDYVDYIIYSQTYGLNLDVTPSGDTVSYRIYGTPTSSGEYEVYFYFFNPEIEEEDGELVYVTISNPPQYTHTIAYNANGGSGSMGNTTVTDTNSGNTNVTFASNGFTAPAHYHFGGWRINNTGTVYQPGSTYAVGGNGSVTAYAYWVIDSHTVTVTSDGNGSVSGGGTYNYGSSCTITATPNAGYRFDHWSDNDTTNPKTFTVTGDVSLTAYFVLDAVTVTGASNGNGSVTGSATYNIGSTATLTAIPDAHYDFIQWDDGTTVNPKSFTVTQAVTYTATFEIQHFTVALTAGTGGSVTGGGTYDYGSSCTITAVPAPGYRFVKWSDDDTSLSRTFTVTQDVTLTATFEENLADYRKLTYGDAKLQVDSAIRDGEGNRIKTIYAKKSEYPIIYVENRIPNDTTDGKDGDIWIQY